MIDPAEPEDVSPYAPPPIVQESLRPAVAQPPSLARSTPLLYAIGATLATAALSFLPALFGGPSLNIGLLLMPFLGIAGFVALCLTMFSRRSDVRARSLVWKIFMMLAVPPAAMLVFVPACTGSAMIILPFVSMARLSSLQWLNFILPMFFALWLTCHVIATRFARRFANAQSLTAPGPYQEIASSPFSSPPVPPAASDGPPDA